MIYKGNLYLCNHCNHIYHRGDVHANAHHENVHHDGVHENVHDNDVCDAICIGASYFLK